MLTSANLSTYALGAGDLKEIGILIDSREIDIDHIISQLKPREWSTAELKHLDQQDKLYAARNRAGASGQAISFVEWHDSEARTDWKLG